MIIFILTLLIILFLLIVWYFINDLILKNELKKYTKDYRIYFEKEHIIKKPFNYTFLSYFMILYNKYHKDEIEYGFLKYKIDRLEYLKQDFYFTNLFKNINNLIDHNYEEELRKKMRTCGLKIKLKKINKKL